MSNPHDHIHIIVEGLVQGVGFRWFVSRIASGLNLTGHVRNLPDGTVEIVAWGHESLLQDLVAQVRTGPRSSQVTNLRISREHPGGDRTSGSGERFEIR